MGAALDYRQRASELRNNVEKTSNPLARLMQKKAAQRFESYADELEFAGAERITLVRHQSAFSV